MSTQVQTKPIETIKSDNRYFYAGMTKAEAEKKDIYSCFMGLDFKDLDTNKDGVLQEGEIRDKKMSRGKVNNVFKYGGAAATLVGAALMFTPFAPIAAPMLFTSGLISMAAGGYQEQVNPNELNEEIYGEDVVQTPQPDIEAQQAELSENRYKALELQLKQQQKMIEQFQKQTKCLQEENASLKISRETDYLEEIAKLQKEVNQLKQQLATNK